MKNIHFSIHPRMGYLNTDFVLWSNDEKCNLTVNILPENEIIYLPEGKSHVIKRFKEGCHTIQYIDVEGAILQEESFQVVNSIKAGGSVVQRRFVLPNWIILVLHDRSYFHNRKTEEEFMEYGIYPENIYEVNNDTLCFVNASNYTFTSISRMKTLVRVHKSKLIYDDEYRIIYLEEGILKYFSICEDKYILLNSPSYTFNKKLQKLFTYNSNDKCLQVIDLESSYFDSKICSLGYSWQFKGFFQSQYLTFEDELLNLHFINAADCDSTFCITLNKLIEVFGQIDPFYKVNDTCIEISWEFRITMIDFENHNYVLDKCKTRRPYGSLYEITYYYISFLIFENNIQNRLLLGEVEFNSDSNGYYIFDTDYGLTIVNKNTRTIDKIKNADFIEHNGKGLCFIEPRKDSDLCRILNLCQQEIFTCEYSYNWNSDFEIYGIIRKGDECYAFYNNEFHLKENGDPDKKIIKLNDGYYFHYNDELRPLPYKISHYTGNIDCLLFTENGQWVVLEWNSKLDKYYQKNIFTKMDQNFFKSAMFCESTSQLLCKLRDDTYCYYDLETGKIEEFQLDSTIVRNFNANQPLVRGFRGKENDKYRKVVFKDPVTLQEITPECLSQYGFFSINRRYGITYNLYNRLYQVKDIKNADGKVSSRVKFIKVHDNVNDCDIEVNILMEVAFINYITFTYDSKKMVVVGATEGQGYLLIYDMEKGKNIFEYPKRKINQQDYSDIKFVSGAIWLASFNKDNILAIYNSNPTTYLFNLENREIRLERLRGRNFLCFSPTGNYFASSNQGYVASVYGTSNWGHQLSTKVFIHRTDDLSKEMGPFEDLGNCKLSAANKNNIGSVAFSQDEKKMLTVGNDGTFVVRNIFLKDESQWKDL